MEDRYKSILPGTEGFFPDLNADAMQELYDHENLQLGDVIGSDAEILGAVFRPAEREVSDEEFLILQRSPMNSRAINERLALIKQEAQYHPEHGRWEYLKGFGRFAITKGGVHIPYADTLIKAEEKSGKTEAATFGLADFGGEKAVLYAMHWDFIGGSVGIIAGEKLLAAAQMAKRKGLPLVAVYSTGGMRQQENFTALSQMHRGVEAVNRFRQETDYPHIAVLLGQVWGGTSASTVPLADTIIGVAGSNFGFAGPKVIGAYQGSIPPSGSQSVESNYLYRNVDVIVGEDELNPYISEYLRVTKPRQKISKQDQVPAFTQQQLWDLKHLGGKKRKIAVGNQGFAPALFSSQEKATLTSEVYEFPDAKAVNSSSTHPDDLFENYLRIISDEGRPDSEFLIKNIFDSAVPLYNHYVRGNKVVYPPIICAFARIGNQPFVVVGDQASYTIRNYQRAGKPDEISIKKHSATPRPEDYERFEEIMDIANTRGLPVITFTDTLGAAPTIESEKRGQSRRIARSIQAIVRHRQPVISVVIGGLGSGGGIATTALSPTILALENSQLWVAEPKSATSILQGTDEPNEMQVKELLGVFECTPEEIKNIGFPIEIIKANSDPFITARNIREKILETYIHQSKLSESRLAKEKRKGYYKLGQKAIKLSNHH